MLVSTPNAFLGEMNLSLGLKRLHFSLLTLIFSWAIWSASFHKADAPGEIAQGARGQSQPFDLCVSSLATQGASGKLQPLSQSLAFLSIPYTW